MFLIVLRAVNYAVDEIRINKLVLLDLDILDGAQIALLCVDQLWGFVIKLFSVVHGNGCIPTNVVGCIEK